MRTKRENFTNSTGRGQTVTFSPALIGENGRMDKRLEAEYRRIAAEGLGTLITAFHDPQRGIKRASR